MSETDRLLITGATGFVGRLCLPLLCECFTDVHATTRGDQTPGDVQWHTIDLLNGNVAALCDRIRPTHLLHLAWIAIPGEYWTSPLNDRWVETSRNLLQAFISSGGKRFVGVGTCAEYDWFSGVCKEYETPLSDSSPYAKAKNAFREEADATAEAAQIQFAWARIFFVFGPGEPPQKLMPSVIRSLLRGDPVECSSGDHARDFVYVKNVGAALAALMQSDLTGPINIGSGQARTIREMVEPVGEKLGCSELLQFTRPAPEEPPLVEADITRLRDELGFDPPLYDAAAARDETIDWWRSEN